MVARRGRREAVCARGAHRARLGGRSASPLGAVLMRFLPNNYPRRQPGCHGGSHNRGSKENDTGAPIFNWPKSACRGFRT